MSKPIAYKIKLIARRFGPRNKKGHELSLSS